MIEGMKMQISTDALKALLEKRVEYHTTKSKWAESKATELAPGLREMEDEAENQGKMSNSYGNNRSPEAALWSQHRLHRDRAIAFRFRADHLIPNETYQLTEDDLRLLEVLGSGW